MSRQIDARQAVRICGGVLLPLVCTFFWLVAAMNYGDDVAVGQYRFHIGSEESTLVLLPDHTFEQTLRSGNTDRTAHGIWRRVGEGGISFSKDFLAVTGAEPEPDGTIFSDMHKTLGLFVSIRIRQYQVVDYGKGFESHSTPGVYQGRVDEPDVTASLTLNEDHTFTQEITHNNSTNAAQGAWSQSSDGTVIFSKTLLKNSGAALEQDETAKSMDPTEHGGLQIEISKAGNSAEPIFSKRFGLW